jgi:hypothetical protein
MARLDDLSFYGSASLTSSGALTMPVRARDELSMAPETTVLVWGSPSSKTAIISVSPDPEKLLEVVQRANLW